MPSTSPGVVSGRDSAPLVVPRPAEDSRFFLSRMPPVRDPVERADVNEHLRSIHHYRSSDGNTSPDLIRRPAPLTTTECERVDVGMAPFYVMSLLKPEYQAIPLDELARGQSVGLNARSLSNDLFIIQPEVLDDARPGCIHPLPDLENAVGEQVRNGFDNRFLPPYTNHGATALFVGVLTHRWNVNEFTPPATKLLGVNVYARIDTEGQLSYCSKLFEVARQQRPGEEPSWRAEPVGGAHREHLATHLATILATSQGLSPWAFQACLLDGWAPGT